MDLNLIIENVCIGHINEGSRLPEAAEIAINENKIEALCESFEDIKLKAKVRTMRVKQKMQKVWGEIKKFFLTIISKLQNLIIDFRTTAKKDKEFLNKYSKEIAFGAKNVGIVDEVEILNSPHNMSPAFVSKTMIDGLFVNCEDEKDMENYIEKTADTVWTNTFGGKQVRTITGEKDRTEVVMKLKFSKQTFDSRGTLSYLSTVIEKVEEVSQGLKALNTVVARADYDAREQYLNMPIPHLDLTAKYYRKCIQDNIVCIRLAFNLLLRSRNAIMGVAKKCIKAAN